MNCSAAKAQQPQIEAMKPHSLRNRRAKGISKGGRARQVLIPHPPLPTPQQLVQSIMPRSNRQRSNYRTQQTARPQEGAKTRHPVPQFIKERRVVNYDHLPRPDVFIYPNGTLSDRIGWVLLHPDLHNHVRLRTSEIPNAEVYIELYR